MLDFIMNLLGYENIEKIKIPEEYKYPRTEKLKCKALFYERTGAFLDKVVINNEKTLLDGYITYILCQWKKIKYIKILKINLSPEKYLSKYRAYRLKPKEKERKERR